MKGGLYMPRYEHPKEVHPRGKSIVNWSADVVFIEVTEDNFYIRKNRISEADRYVDREYIENVLKDDRIRCVVLDMDGFVLLKNYKHEGEKLEYVGIKDKSDKIKELVKEGLECDENRKQYYLYRIGKQLGMDLDSLDDKHLT